MIATRSAVWPQLKRDLVGILRGLPPGDCEAVVSALIEEGFAAIEIPLNSPEPFRSIEMAAKLAPDGVLIGAGTVLTPEQVDHLHSAGGTLLVSPNVDVGVLARATRYGMVTMPGVFTPTEALAAIAAGASALKFFPASVLGPDGVKAISVVLPKGVPLGVVGGVSEADFAAYGKVGVRHFGLGSSIYKPGDNAELVRIKAKGAITAYDAAFG